MSPSFISSMLSIDHDCIILKCAHSSESYWTVLSCGTVYLAVQADFTFWPSDVQGGGGVA